ncbi:MAG: glutaredoxin 3 [Coxiellaceae bacterium]|nr:glutaredoxin 3 [Coxiellaceae bacterium]
MAEVVIYSKAVCPFCDRAKELLTQKGVAYTEKRIDQNQDDLKQMLAMSNGQRTVPQIFIGDHHVGGFDDLWALEQAGDLDPLLSK